MSVLLNIIHHEIETNGPMDIGRYMSLCLGHPKHGYYMTRDPFGVDGDFTTAPEISQMFGELIGAWLLDAWARHSAPTSFALVELGPGRGTLMSDILRVGKNVPGFIDGAQIHLVETSPILKQVQADTLSAYDVVWHDGVESLPDECPLFVVANEFLDALPIHQLLRTQTGWDEYCVGLDSDGRLMMGRQPAALNLIEHIPPALLNGEEGEIVEVSPVINQYMAQLCQRIKKQGGAAIFIDYGHIKSAAGDTLQAVQHHKYVDVLYAPGEVDITAHVNFENIARIVDAAGLVSYPIMTQGEFLKEMGIDIRAEALKNSGRKSQKNKINQSVERLCGDKGMGRLFKVIRFESEKK